MVTASERLKEILKIRNITQKELVEMAQPLCAQKGMKLSPSKFNQYVTGKSIPDQGMILLLAEVLDVNPAWLDGWDAPMKMLTGDEATSERMDVVKDVFPRLSQFDQKKIVAEMVKKASEL